MIYVLCYIRGLSSTANSTVSKSNHSGRFQKTVTCNNFLTEYKLYLSETHFLLYSSRCTYLNFCVREDYAILQEQAKLWANLTQLASFPTEIADSNFSQSITYLSIFR